MEKTQITISKIYIYPLKSGKEQELNESQILKTGLQFDRTLLILRKSDLKFLTIRTHPKLYDIIIKYLDPTKIQITIPNNNLNDDIFYVELEQDINKIPQEEQVPAKVWFTSGIGAIIRNNDVHKHLSEYLDEEVLLVNVIYPRFIMEGNERLLKLTKNIKEGDSINFNDYAPILVSSEESLNCLNDYIKENGEKEVEMRNFRPNIVLKGFDKPFMEESIEEFEVNGIVFRSMKNCIRCKLTTYDMNERKFRETNEPLNTLRKIKMSSVEEGVIFGQYFNVDLGESGCGGDCRIKVNDVINIKE